MQTMPLINASAFLLQGLAGRKAVTGVLHIVIKENMGFEN
jgi:hypothetical protein